MRLAGLPGEASRADDHNRVLPLRPSDHRANTQKTSRFSREVLATMISLASAGFGVVAALAWNAAI